MFKNKVLELLSTAWTFTLSMAGILLGIIIPSLFSEFVSYLGLIVLSFLTILAIIQVIPSSSKDEE
ncbi:MAG: hypothetical protein ACTSR2_14335 [Candidatus Hodarchaeales archaeon]